MYEAIYFGRQGKAGFIHMINTRNIVKRLTSHNINVSTSNERLEQRWGQPSTAVTTLMGGAYLAAPWQQANTLAHTYRIISYLYSKEL